MAVDRCPPGFFCMHNMTLVTLSIFFLIVTYFIFSKIGKSFTLNDTENSLKQHINTLIHNDEISQHIQQTPVLSNTQMQDNTYFTNPNYIMSNEPDDIYLNPYAAPRKQNAYFSPPRMNIPTQCADVRGCGVPINQSTRNLKREFTQIGILTRKSSPVGEEQILPLFGRPLHTNRNKWQYYTVTDKNNAVKLPINVKGRNSTGDIGVDEIMNSEDVVVQGYNDTFAVNIYENATPEYIPYL